MGADNRENLGKIIQAAPAKWTLPRLILTLGEHISPTHHLAKTALNSTRSWSRPGDTSSECRDHGIDTETPIATPPKDHQLHEMRIPEMRCQKRSQGPRLSLTRGSHIANPSTRAKIPAPSNADTDKATPRVKPGSTTYTSHKAQHPVWTKLYINFSEDLPDTDLRSENLVDY